MPQKTRRKRFYRRKITFFSADLSARCVNIVAVKKKPVSFQPYAAEDVFSSAQRMDAMPAHASETLCYFFCGNGGTPRWVVAPWGQLGGECGFILAADASFCCNVDEFGGLYGASR